MSEAKVHPAIRPAEEKYQKLIDRTYVGKGKWRSDAWQIIERSLEDEGPFIHECDPTAICTYGLYVEVAFTYLNTINDRHGMERLLLIVRSDIAKLGEFALSNRAISLDETEQKMIFYAMKLCRVHIEKLKEKYPDTE